MSATHTGYQETHVSPDGARSSSRTYTVGRVRSCGPGCRILARVTALALVTGLLVCSPVRAGDDTEVDVAQHRPRALQQRLNAALAAKGPEYRPRTEHLLPNGRPRFTNRLILEDSPYLLQHAHNPVDWHPWGPEAFAQARREEKPVFLSIGYSTCHWCHVMERESFENLEIARLLNRHYVAIKVDREVRPDLDQVYMIGVELLTGQGGWPMSSILTPEGETIVAGTYFPPEDFARLLTKIEALWKERPSELRAQARDVATAVARALATSQQAAELDSGIARRTAAALISEHDALQGGFGSAPKFPREPWLALLLDQALRSGDPQFLDVATFTLKSMTHGGIHDQVGGGFHRYAIDDGWLVPHFEKMLYNQAQLARLYTAAARLTGDSELARTARRTLDFVLRDLTSPEGVFYSATDADSEGGEGRFFLWTPDEIRAALPQQDADLAIRFFGVSRTGNFDGLNILHIPQDPEAFAQVEGLTAGQLWTRIDTITAALNLARAARPHPHRDDKVLSSWNGMMITALAEADEVLGESGYRHAALRAAETLWARVRPATGELRRVYLDGRASMPGLQDDYAFLGEGMLALYDITGDPKWLARARELADALWRRFADPDGGGLYMAEADNNTPQMARPKDLRDGAMPSGTSASLSLFAGLARRTDLAMYGERAQQILASVSAQVRRTPKAFPSLLVALSRLRSGETGPRQYAAGGAVRVEARVTVTDSGAGVLEVALTLSPGWHINASAPLQDHLIPTRLGLGSMARGWRLAAPDYPTPGILKLGFESEPLAVYQGRVRITTAIEDQPEGDTTTAWLPAELRLQACSLSECLPPETLSLQVPAVAQRSMGPELSKNSNGARQDKAPAGFQTGPPGARR